MRSKPQLQTDAYTCKHKQARKPSQPTLGQARQGTSGRSQARQSKHAPYMTRMTWNALNTASIHGMPEQTNVGMCGNVPNFCRCVLQHYLLLCHGSKDQLILSSLRRSIRNSVSIPYHKTQLEELHRLFKAKRHLLPRHRHVQLKELGLD